MAVVFWSPIALATVVVLTLSACSGAGETVLEDTEPEILGERENNRSSIACEADSEGLYEQDFSSETLGEEFEYFVTRDWDLWEESPELDREGVYSPANSADLILDSEGSRTFVSLNEPEDLLKYSPNGGNPLGCADEYKFSLDFRVAALEGEPEDDDGCRTLVTTTGAYRDNLGFTVMVCRNNPADNEKLTFWTSSGAQWEEVEGEEFDGYDAPEGYQRFNGQLDDSGWNSLSLRFRFGLDSPRVEINLNGLRTNVRLVEGDRADFADIKNYLAGPDFELWLGGHPDNYFINNFPWLQMDIARFDLSVGAREQDSVMLASILTEMSEGNTTRARDQDLVEQFSANFENEWAGIGDAVVSFIEDTERDGAPLFNIARSTSLLDLSPRDLLQFELKQWILDDLSADITGPIAFQESRVFPGSVSPSAPRETVEVEIDGAYNTDPNFLLNGSGSVARPTGRYLAPGEIATVTVPESVTELGWEVQVGAHSVDLERSYYDWNRFPRISRSFALDSPSVEVDNPLGGALYVYIPDGSNAGSTLVGITGTVEMPSYWRTDSRGSESNLAAFRAAVAKKEVPWFEVIGDSFAFTYPMGMAHLYQDPDAVIDVMEESLDAINVMAGRPQERFRAEWIVIDSENPDSNVPFYTGYPSYGYLSFFAEFQAETQTAFTPYDRLDYDGFWSALPLLERDVTALDLDARVFWHEWGHLHNLPTGPCQEVEANVHLLANVVFNTVLGADMDTAVRNAGPQDYDRTDAALDMMFSPNWQIDERFCEDEWDNEVRYQNRAFARWADIADLYGWEAVGAIHREFYLLGTDALHDEDLIVLGSQALNKNLAPLFEFWGVPADPATKRIVEALPPATEFIERLELYKSVIPASESQQRSKIEGLVESSGNAERWFYYMDNYDPAVADFMEEKIDRLIGEIR